MLRRAIRMLGRVREMADAVAFTAERASGDLRDKAPRAAAALDVLCSSADAAESFARRVARVLEDLQCMLAIVSTNDEPGETTLSDPRDAP